MPANFDAAVDDRDKKTNSNVNQPVASSHSPSPGQTFTPPKPSSGSNQSFHANQPVPSSHSPSPGQTFTPPNSGGGSSDQGHHDHDHDDNKAKGPNTKKFIPGKNIGGPIAGGGKVIFNPALYPKLKPYSSSALTSKNPSTKLPEPGQASLLPNNGGPGVIAIPADAYLMAKTTQLGRSILKAFMHEGFPGAEVTAANWLRHFARYGWDPNETAQATTLFNQVITADSAIKQNWSNLPVVFLHNQSQTDETMISRLANLLGKQTEPITPTPTATSMPPTPTLEQQRYLQISQSIVQMMRNDPQQYEQLLRVVQTEIGSKVNGTYTDDQARAITWVIMNNLAWTASGDIKSVSNLQGTPGYKNIYEWEQSNLIKETLRDQVISGVTYAILPVPFNSTEPGSKALMDGVEQALNEFSRYGYRTTADPTQGSLQYRHAPADRKFGESDVQFWEDTNNAMADVKTIARNTWGRDDYFVVIPPIVTFQELDQAGEAVARLGYLMLFAPNDPNSDPINTLYKFTRNINGELFAPIVPFPTPDTETPFDTGSTTTP